MIIPPGVLGNNCSDMKQEEQYALELCGGMQGR